MRRCWRSTRFIRSAVGLADRDSLVWVMGTISVDMWVGNPFADAGTTVSALVDTGATNPMLPASLLRQLGIAPVEKRFVRVADRRRVELQTAWARFSVQGRNAVGRVAFGPEGQFLMGATTLEGLALAVDPVDQRLIEQEDLLMSAG